MVPSSTPPRLHVAEGPRSLEIVIERQRGLLPGFFLGVWVLGSAFAAWSTARHLGEDPWSPGSAYLALWLLASGLGGVTVAVLVLVLFIGQETVEVADGALRLGVRIGPFRRDRSYALAGVANLRATGPSAVPPAILGEQGRGTWGGIAFEHAGRTIRFGVGLENREARRVLGAIRSRLSSA